jgi:sulfite dehydrogenase (cytochrome) subunit A
VPAVFERELSRRRFLGSAAIAAVGAATWNTFGAETITLPFANGERPLVKYPQKRPLIRHTTRPPQLETPFSVFNEGVLTPNDAFFVRYHLALSPPSAGVLTPETFRVSVGGAVNAPLKLSVAELKQQFENVELVAVNQCSGNSRGFSNPRVPGGQSGHGAMGNARWRGVRLRDVLKKAGVGAGAKQVAFNGLDAPLLPQTPDYIKALDIDHALDGELMLAFGMNGKDLPWLNGYPLRLVVPGHYGTYWVKHVNDIQVLDKTYEGWWMNPAYRIPDNDCACVPPGTAPTKTVPIARYNVRSFITSIADGGKMKAGAETLIKGIAFDGGSGIKAVAFSADGGRTWQEAKLGKDLGKYSFREWTIAFTPKSAQALQLKSRATSRSGQTQPAEAIWNPPGYMRNVIETVRVEVA